MFQSFFYEEKGREEKGKEWVFNVKLFPSKLEGFGEKGKEPRFVLFKFTKLPSPYYIRSLYYVRSFFLRKPNCRCRLSSPLLPRCPFERSSPNLRRFSSSIIRGKLVRGTSLSGFSWNSTTQLIEAENEVWDKLIESKPAAASLKTKKVSNFNEMLELFAKDRASGAQVETAKERNARLQKNDTINLETVPEVDDFLAANDVILESQYDIGDDIQVMHPMSSQPEHSSSAKKCKSRKRKVEHEDGDLTTMIINSVGGVANAIREGKKLFRRAIKY